MHIKINDANAHEQIPTRETITYITSVTSTTLYIWSETVPNWLTAIAAIGAAWTFVWRRQDRQESKAREDLQTSSGVEAAWVTVKVAGADERQWGILVSNRLDHSIDEIEVKCQGNKNSSLLAYSSLPPGNHFFASAPRNSGREWGFPTLNFAEIEYIGASTKHKVSKVLFRYNDQQHERALQDD